MLALIDTTNLPVAHRAYDWIDAKLPEFIDEIAKANPLLEFYMDDNCWGGAWRNGDHQHFLNRVKVRQSGEELGSVGMTLRYLRGDKENVYTIESFRIEKQRGRSNTTLTKDLKVALRTVKKAFYPRKDHELHTLMSNELSQLFNMLTDMAQTEFRWAFNTHQEGMNFAVEVCKAMLEGKTQVTLPTKVASCNNMEKLFDAYKNIARAEILKDKFINRKGYGVKVSENLYVTLDLANGTVSRAMAYDELPEPIAKKLGVFKILNDLEIADGIGVKHDKIVYITDDEIPSA